VTATTERPNGYLSKPVSSILTSPRAHVLLNVTLRNQVQLERNRYFCVGFRLRATAQEGFPFSDGLFHGNRADVSTVEAILRTVERKHGKARCVWIFDRGVVSEEHLVANRKGWGQYLVGTPRSKLKQFEQELLKDDFEKIRPEVEPKQITIPGNAETYILCRTAWAASRLPIRR
jgi:hypothetical protein